MTHDDRVHSTHEDGMTDEEWRAYVESAVRTHGEKAKAKRAPKRIGTAKRRGWRAPMAIWMVWCDACERHVVDYLAGYGRLTCPKCRRQFRVMTWRRFRDKVLWGSRVPFLVLVVSAAAVAYAIHACL